MSVFLSVCLSVAILLSSNITLSVFLHFHLTMELVLYSFIMQPLIQHSRQNLAADWLKWRTKKNHRTKKVAKKSVKNIPPPPPPSPYSRWIFSVLLRWANAIKVWANAIKCCIKVKSFFMEHPVLDRASLTVGSFGAGSVNMRICTASNMGFQYFDISLYHYMGFPREVTKKCPVLSCLT